MTSNDDSRDTKSPPGSAGSNVSGKRPHATLDLKAVEIKEPPPRKPAPQSADASSSTRQSAQSEQTDDKQSTGTQSSVQTADGERDKQQTTSSKTPPPTDPPVQIVKRRGGFFGPLVGGILGGLLALFGGDYLLQRLGIPKMAGSATQSIDTIEAQLADLDAQLSTLESQKPAGGAQDPQTLETINAHQEKLATLSTTTAELAVKQSALEVEVAELAKRPPGTASTNVDGITQRLADLEQRIGTGTAQATTDQNTEPAPQIVALSQKIAELERTLAAQPKVQSDPALSEAQDTQVKEAIAAAATAKSETARLDTEFGVIKSTTNRLDKRVDALRTSSDQLSESIKILNETSLKMSSEITNLRTNLQNELGSVARPADINAAVTPYKDRIATLESSLKVLEKVEAARAAQAKNVVLSLELSNLQRALNSGQPFAEELNRVKATTNDPANLEKLENYAGRGVPTLATLRDTFRPLIHQILNASATNEDASLFSQFVDRAKSVVRVRKVAHDKDDTSVEAIVARIEENLKTGKLTAVVDEAKALPDANKAPVETWLEQVIARTTVDHAMATLQSNLKMALSKTTLTSGR